MKLETLSVHAGYSPDPTTKPLLYLFTKQHLMHLMIRSMVRISLT